VDFLHHSGHRAVPKEDKAMLSAVFHGRMSGAGAPDPVSRRVLSRKNARDLIRRPFEAGFR
jgi:hypothetical protein